MDKISCGIVSIIIGREYSIDPLLNYFKNLETPNEINELNLYLILGCNSNFIKSLKIRYKV
jgi:hypothetical protein